MEKIAKRSSLCDELEEVKRIYYSLFDGNQEENHEQWLSKVDTLISDLDNRLETLEDEQLIENLTLELRSMWFEQVQRVTNQHLKSPPLASRKFLPSTRRIDFSYERNIQPLILEKEIKGYRAIGENWVEDHVLLSSGMAAISTFLQSYFGMFKPTSEKKLRMASWSDYFETRMLTDLYRSEAVEITSFAKQEDFMAQIGEIDLFYIEPVRYNWHLEVFSLDVFLQELAINGHQGLKMIVLDTTLNGDTLDMDYVLDQLHTVANVIVVQIHSILKLDQQGLEFSNGGLVSFYTDSTNPALPNAVNLADYIRKIRTVLGTGLSYQEISLLDNQLLFHKNELHQYCESIFENNALLAAGIHTDRIFKQVEHPSLTSDQPWAKAPFVVFHLREDTLINHGIVLAVVNEEVKKHKATFIYGSSFGFRHHRYEVIIPNTSTGKGLFKVAMGRRRGPTMDFILQLFQKLSTYPDVKSLLEDYPHVEPVDLTNL
ncbi:hypothetical protein RYX56_08345 [Alkalihalophilus lindianensis]|uniref:Uncharacterized protein n=1 Tax=Alkalihalophilus lindianensis TaxID=1630542 RepID=A0ABU3XAQ8_9BACI|nr:hypothetical protein [Alkalihalophilus lindianensis]MDV2684378.1 hypothetical protein [Alkalihalophilus lindianensis]